MDEREYRINTKEANVERSTEDIRQDIAKEKENISQTVEQIGERIKEKMDWRGYVKDSPYWALGVGQAKLGRKMLGKKRMHLKVESIRGRDEVRALYRRAQG